MALWTPLTEAVDSRTMSPGMWRALRAASTPLLLVLTLAVAGSLAWLIARREALRTVTPTVCSRAIDEAFGLDASRTSDAVLLDRLLAHRARCAGDAAYVDQARRLMVNLQRVDDARALLDEAARRRALTADELAAERAWVDLEASRVALANGDHAGARQAYGRAVAAVDTLGARWPEWAVPYTIMTELRRSVLADTSGSEALRDPLVLERAARARIDNGAVMRSLTRSQVMVVAFLAGALGVLGLATVASAAASIRAMRGTRTATVAEARPGFVELTGTLRLPPRAEAVVGPLTKRPGVWYAVESTFGGNGSRSFRERSAQLFLLRDATGEVAIDPTGMTVRTRHSVTRFGGARHITAGPRTTERLLCEGDEAYVLGELAHVPSGGGTVRRVRVPEDGRPLVVSNYSEDELVQRERYWLLSGALLLVVSVATVLWGYAQRYEVQTIPGVLD